MLADAKAEKEFLPFITTTSNNPFPPTSHTPGTVLFVNKTNCINNTHSNQGS